MMQVTHNNHFVPQSYLRRWSDDRHYVWCYRILVPNKKVPEWTSKPVRGVAYHRDLYTASVGGKEIDEFERWLETEFETPAQSAIERAIHGDILSSSDWEHLIRYMAAQHVRTPQNYIDLMERWKDPETFQEIVNNIMRKLERAKQTGLTPSTELPTGKPPFSNVLKVKVNPHPHSGTNQAEIRVNLVVGRLFWLEYQRHILTKTVQKFMKHNWSIAEASNGIEWITSDQPVACVNYYGEDNFDFKGGWGKKCVDLIMPLSPKHLLFTEIGTELPKRFTISDRLFYLCQKFIAYNAHRMIFAHKPMPFINLLHPRIVNNGFYRVEQEAWRNWHSDQSKAEQDLDNDN